MERQAQGYHRIPELRHGLLWLGSRLHSLAAKTVAQAALCRQVGTVNRGIASLLLILVIQCALVLVTHWPAQDASRARLEPMAPLAPE